MCIDPDAVERDGDAAPPSGTEPKSGNEVPAEEAIVIRDPIIKSPPPEPEEEQESINSDETPHNAVFDDILSHSQARLLESIAALGKNVDFLIGRAVVGSSLGGSRDRGKGKISLEDEGGEIL